jgi:flagellin-like hook-associated protein FlgL
MRTTFLMQGRDTLRNLRASAALRRRAELELSSGIRTSKPSDSPVDAAGIVRTHSAIASTQQFRGNLQTLQSELQAVDGTLFEAVNALQRGLTLATQGAGGTQDAHGRELIAVELDGVLRHLNTLANSVYDGRYLFAGAADSNPPFETGASGRIEYQGDSQHRLITFLDGRSAQVSLPGDAIFLTQDELKGAGRAAPPSGTPPPSPPVSIGVALSGDLDAVLTADLPGPYLAASPPSGAAPGDIVSVRLQSNDGAIDQTLTLPPLSGGENAAALASSLNAAIAANPQLDGKVRFVDQGGALQFEVREAAGAGFSFSQSVSGAVTTGLEAGGQAGGYSAQEIAAAFNAQVAAVPELLHANLRFEAVDGEIVADSDLDLSLHVIDFDRGTGFDSGLAGVHRIGGKDSANVFAVIEDLVTALRSNDSEGAAQGVVDLQRAVDHLSGSQAFYGATLRQVELTLATLADLAVVHEQRLSEHRDADVLESIALLQQSTSAEQFAIQVAARRQQTILDVLA